MKYVILIKSYNVTSLINYKENQHVMPSKQQRGKRSIGYNWAHDKKS